jgi:hypothetical protein
MQWSHLDPTLFNEKVRLKNRESLISWFLFLKLFFTAFYKVASTKSVVRGNLSDEYDEDSFL